MADKPNIVVQLSPRQAAARQIQEELAAKAAAGETFNETVPGGYFIGTDGEPHDSEGRPIKKAAEAEATKAKGKGK